MRVATSHGRVVLVTEHSDLDVARASDGRFGPDPLAALDDWDALRSWAADLDSAVATDGDGRGGAEPGHRGAVVPWPRQVFAIGMNYRDHVAEAGFELPTTPSVFTKFPSAITGPRDEVVLPNGAVDWEVELVVVIGRRCDHVDEQDAWGHVAGVTVGQDLSDRELQLAGAPPQFSLGKSHRGFAPVGPELVTIDELDDPDDLALGCGLEGGEVLQTGRTSELVFPVPELIARLSAVCTLFPGDLIFTGTPAGIGGTRVPPQFLRDGDVLESWVEGVGRMRNPMVAGPASDERTTPGEQTSSDDHTSADHHDRTAA